MAFKQNTGNGIREDNAKRWANCSPSGFTTGYTEGVKENTVERWTNYSPSVCTTGDRDNYKN